MFKEVQNARMIINHLNMFLENKKQIVTGDGGNTHIRHSDPFRTH